MSAADTPFLIWHTPADDGRALALHIALPKGPPQGWVLYAHGGSFIHGRADDRIARALAPRLTAQGIGFASLAYRRGDKAGAAARLDPATKERLRADQDRLSRALGSEVVNPILTGALYLRARDDLAAAMTHLRGQTDAPIALCGMSAGGIAALGLAHPPAILRATLPRPAGVVALSALHPTPWDIGAGGPPIGLLWGSLDAVIPSSARALTQEAAQKAQVLGLSCTLPQGDHNRPIREIAAQSTQGQAVVAALIGLLAGQPHPREVKHGAQA